MGLILIEAVCLCQSTIQTCDELSGRDHSFEIAYAAGESGRAARLRMIISWCPHDKNPVTPRFSSCIGVAREPRVGNPFAAVSNTYTGMPFKRRNDSGFAPANLCETDSLPLIRPRPTGPPSSGSCGHGGLRQAICGCAP